MLVGAVLDQMKREHGQLETVRLAAEALDDALVLGVGEAEFAVRRQGAHAVATSSSTCAARGREQRAAVGGPGERVHGVLGVGHQPHHVSGAFATPAMSLTDPLGFWPGA